MSVTVEQAKESMGVDDVYDTFYIKLLIEAAEEYIIEAIDRNNIDKEINAYKQFDVAVILTVTYWYKYQLSPNMERLPDQVIALIQQMRAKYYVNH